MTHMQFSKDKFRIVNMFLALFCAAIAIWVLWLWLQPKESPSLSAEETTSRPAVKEVAKIELKRADAYYVIESKDLFRSSRRKYVPPSRPKPVKVAAPPPPAPPPAPKLTLVGTLFLDDGWAALVAYAGNAATYYKVGDTLRDFTVKEISKNYIVINRGDESVRFNMDKTEKSSTPRWPVQR